jgi:PIN domain nuclease of toxin-antitoxin system
LIVLDAYAVLALLKGESAAGQVRQLLAGEDEAALTALGVAEVVDHLIRLAGADEEDAALDVAQLRLDSPSPVDAALALQAGLLRARHYHRKNRAVSLADCVAAETARPAGSSLASADPHLLDLCRDEGIASIPLPDSGGQTWSP